MQYCQTCDTPFLDSVFALSSAGIPGGAFSGTGPVDPAEWANRASIALDLGPGHFGQTYEESRVKLALQLARECLERAGYPSDFLTEVCCDATEADPVTTPNDLSHGEEEFASLKKAITSHHDSLYAELERTRERLVAKEREVDGFREMLEGCESDITFTAQEILEVIEIAGDSLQGGQQDVITCLHLMNDAKAVLEGFWDDAEPSQWYAEGVYR